MALLNYTTTIKAWQTVSEIQQILARAGASHINMRTVDGNPIAVNFSIDLNGQPLNFSLPCNVEGIKNFMKTDKVTRKKLSDAGKLGKVDEQAANVGWRILKDWIEAQLALIQVEMVTLQEVFMPYLVINSRGETLADRMLLGNGLKLLTSGE